MEDVLSPFEPLYLFLAEVQRERSSALEVSRWSLVQLPSASPGQMSLSAGL